MEFKTKIELLTNVIASYMYICEGYKSCVVVIYIAHRSNEAPPLLLFWVESNAVSIITSSHVVEKVYCKQ